MKKGFFYGTLIGLAAGLFLGLEYYQPRLFSNPGADPGWDHARFFLLAVMMAFICTLCVELFVGRAQLKPYYQKFKKFCPFLYQLVRRDFLAKYKRSFLGVLWSLLNPLFTMIVMTIVFSFIFRFEIENFPVYLLSGQVVFTLYSETTNMCLNSVLSGAPLMKKVSMPKYIFPLSKALSCMINFFFSFLALLLVMLITGARFYPQMLFFPVVLFLIFVFSTGIGMVLAALNVFFRDVSYLYGVFMTALTYFTPLFYPISIIPDKFRWIISLNPMFHYVECFRTCVIYGGIPSLWQMTLCVTFAVLALGLGLIVFNKKQDQFILYV